MSNPSIERTFQRRFAPFGPPLMSNVDLGGGHMAKSIDPILQRQIQPTNVRPDGSLTYPRSYGVYQLPVAVKATRRFPLREPSRPNA